ncbi:MAG: YdcF family protein [Pseudomonadota bacterium]
MTLYLFLRSLLAPPGPQLLLVLAGLWCQRRHRRWLGAALLALGLGSLYLMATPMGALGLARGLERYPALTADPRAWEGAQAIVVLGGGRDPAPEFGGQDKPGWWTASRLRYGAFLYRRSGLPLAVTGGRGEGDAEPEATAMARSLREDYIVNVRWEEGDSRTTWENAMLTRQLLARDGVERVLLVTQGLHMRRAVMAFRHAGFTVVPAPLDFVAPAVARRPWLLRLAPSPEAFMISGQALHEYAGLAAYRLRMLAD